ncbi:MAG: cob(I)yrinic acid a,c-diamide adenosyltransferase [Clostridiales bacterium]|jgi:cob(I)alamin adenosyltransferase|nr:cob(I)yrinic acid a,c-diamide adenosyltransferase [Clostridiales bacterium]
MGYTQVYTGDGKGKTTAALGLALRASGCGLKVYFGQFLKKGYYSEIAALGTKLPEITVEQYGLEGRKPGAPMDEGDRRAALAGLKKAKAALESGLYDVVILDELNVAAMLELVSVDDILELIERRGADTELVLTGRGAKPEICGKADLVTEMKEVKHYYQRGVGARKGIEF